MTEEGTLVQNPIRRPDEPRHFMVLKELAHEVVAERAGERVASSTAAIRCQEAGRDLYDPVVYFPRDAVVMDRLRKNDNSTTCPLKGHTEYFDLVLEGGQTIENAAWSYREVYDFDDRLAQLKGRIAFDTRLVQVTERTVTL